LSNERRGQSRHWLVAIIAALVVIGAVAAYAAFGRDGDEEGDGSIPAFEAGDLVDSASKNWPHVGGSLANDRYSELDEINTENVADLKGVWKTDLRGSGLEAKYSGESQPVVYDGVIYVTTGKNDVFAVDVVTGKILWQYKGNLNKDISTVCCGWLNRGVAIGNGTVFQGQLDGNVVALDARTGALKWKRKLVKWEEGQTITGAPTYADGRIYLGVVGADLGTRSFLEAMDAETGKSVWRWYAIPAPGEPGGDTWPEGTDAYLRGGGAIWQAPAYDPDLGLLYVSTGNAGPDWDGTVRKGDNLWTASIVAINAEDGKLKWGFQQVHHDIWDWDAASPVVLFEGSDGRKGVAQAGKTGWLYMLDRETGEPLYGIEERPVPQDPRQFTAATQPFPKNGAFIPHGPVPQSEVDRIKKARTKEQAGLKVVAAPEMFTPPGIDGTLVAIMPGPQGGVNWNPISYNPETDMFYICSSVQTAGEMASPGGEWKEGQYYIGGVIVGAGFTESFGTFTAIDALSGNRVWQKRFPEACYSGTSTTKGNLVFLGRTNGELEAYDARDGKRLWKFQTGAGANNTATIFEHDGKEYVVFLSQGNSLIASPHGDELWLFGLDGTMGPAESPEGGAGTEHGGEGEGEQAGPEQGDAEAGQQVYADSCSGCHGLSGTGGNGGPDISDPLTLAQIIAQVTNGGTGMPAFKGQLDQQQISDVSAYVYQDLQGQEP
jgi:quinohemoprotein ethanol dehydrogenase